MSEDQSTAFKPLTGCRCPECIAYFARRAAAARDCKTSPEASAPLPPDGKAGLDLRAELVAEKKARQQAEAIAEAAQSRIRIRALIGDALPV